MKLSVVICLAIPLISACDWVPGTEGYKIAQAKKDVSGQLIDPTSPLFRNVRLNNAGTAICGEYNGKNRNGAYVGFSKFVAPEKSITGAQLDPEYDESYQHTLDSSCTAALNARIYAGEARRYGISVPAMSSDAECKAAADYRSKQRDQARFSRLWWRECYYNGAPPSSEKWLQD